MTDAQKKRAEMGQDRWRISSPVPAGFYQADWSQRGWWGVPTVARFTPDTSLPIPLEPAWAWPGQALVLLKLARPGSSAPTGPNTLILILSERRIERGRHSTHISCTSCKPHMLHVTSLWFNGLQKEMKRETKRAAAVICLVYVNRLALGSYYSSPTSHTRELKPSGAIKGLNGVMRTHKHKPWFPECLLNSLCRTWGHTYGKWEVKKKTHPRNWWGGPHRM